MRIIVLLSILVMFAKAASAADQTLLLDRPAESRPSLLVVGSAHFENPGRDAVNPKIEDMLTPLRQREIDAFIEQLLTFKPTHVAIEWDAADQKALTEKYTAYLNGKATLGASEKEQLGFRLAKKAKLENVYAIDWNQAPPGDFAQYDFSAYAKAHGDGGVLAKLLDPKRMPVQEIGGRSVRDWLLAINQSDALAYLHRLYFDIALIGSGNERPGANWVGSWYGRNLRIFGNLVRITDDRDARMVVIYGAGHGYLLRQFAKESRAFNVTDLDQVVTRSP